MKAIMFVWIIASSYALVWHLYGCKQDNSQSDTREAVQRRIEILGGHDIGIFGLRVPVLKKTAFLRTVVVDVLRPLSANVFLPENYARAGWKTDPTGEGSVIILSIRRSTDELSRDLSGIEVRGRSGVVINKFRFLEKDSSNLDIVLIDEAEFQLKSSECTVFVRILAQHAKKGKRFIEYYRVFQLAVDEGIVKWLEVQERGGEIESN